MERQSRAYAYAAATILFWSTVATAFKLALQGLQPVQLLALASVTSALALVVVLGIQGRWGELLRQNRVQWMHSAGLGLLNPLLYYLVLFEAYDRLPAQEALALNYTWPIVLSVLAVPVLGQRLGLPGLVGLVISFGGVVIIGTRGDPFSLKFDDPFGCFLAVSSSLIWASFWLLNVRDKREETLKLTTSFLFGAAYTVALLPFLSTLPQLSARPWLAAAYAGLFEMGITFVLWLRALSLSERSATVSQLIYLAPFLSLVFIRLVLGEELRASSIVGLVLIIGGILIQRLKR